MGTEATPFASRAGLAATTALIMLLSGCAELACRQGPLQRQLSFLESEYSITAGNVSRGYALHKRSEKTLVPYTELFEQCEAFNDRGQCTLYGTRGETRYREEWRTVEEPVAIDIDDERRRLEDYLDRLNAIRPAAEQEFAQCMASRA